MILSGVGLEPFSRGRENGRGLWLLGKNGAPGVGDLLEIDHPSFMRLVGAGKQNGFRQSLAVEAVHHPGVDLLTRHRAVQKRAQHAQGMRGQRVCPGAVQRCDGAHGHSGVKFTYRLQSYFHVAPRGEFGDQAIFSP